MKKPEALRLADELERAKRWGCPAVVIEASAAEMRRLHASCEDYAQHKQRQDQRVLELKAQRDALLEALRWIDKRCPEPNWADVEPHRIHFEMAHDAGACARAAIAAVEGEKT